MDTKANGSAGADREMAMDAVDFVRPLLESALRAQSMGQSGVLYVVVMDPTKRPGDCAFEQAILFEHGFGKERGAWDADYAWYAREKARLSWEFQRDSGVLQCSSPHLLQPQHARVWGSVWLDGIVVAISGLEPMFDEALSGVIAMCLRGFAKARAAGLDPR